MILVYYVYAHVFIHSSYYVIKQTYIFFFFNDTATTEIYTLSLHDALPISRVRLGELREVAVRPIELAAIDDHRSEEHTSELQSRLHLVCRLLLEKKKKKMIFFRAFRTWFRCAYALFH